jgi:hypothetical protein
VTDSERALGGVMAGISAAAEKNGGGDDSGQNYAIPHYGN